jgi:chromatin segregation and condensation protein Rec8/ScpA/Scc1 (kleisin family)
LILSILNKRNVIQFFQTYQKKEGKQGVVVALLASLDLAKDGHVELIQNPDSNQLYLKSTNRGGALDDRFTKLYPILLSPFFLVQADLCDYLR